jgi:iron(III) transport system permease protein
MAGLSLALPVVTIGIWLTRGLAAGVDVRLDAGLATSSLVLSGSSMVLATVVALPIARLVTAYPGRWSVTVERLLYGIYAVPSISLALAFVYRQRW